MRHLYWIARVLVAFVRGLIVRTLRRIARRPPRIWHGFTPMFFTREMVESDRIAGFPSRAVAQHTKLQSYALVSDEEFDAVYTGGKMKWHESHWRSLIDLLVYGDIWFAFFDSFFFRIDQPRANELAFLLLRLAGIRIVVAPHGGDVVYRHRYVSRYDWIARMQRDYPDWDLVAQERSARARIDTFCRYADLVISNSYLSSVIPRSDLNFPYVSVDCVRLRPTPGTSTPPRIIHAPNHRYAKGTDLLLGALAVLQAKGFTHELVLVEGVPRVEALKIYATADIIADQFVIGGFGVFACEGMALGKTVLTYLDEGCLGDPVYNHPLVNSTPENLTRVLAALLAIPELRGRLGIAGRRSMENYQSIPEMASVWREIYSHVWWGSPMRLEDTPPFSRDRKPRSYTTDPADETFWPVEVEDLMGEIRAAVERAG